LRVTRRKEAVFCVPLLLQASLQWGEQPGEGQRGTTVSLLTVEAARGVGRNTEEVEFQLLEAATKQRLVQ
jgi:hypothetical protein